MLLRPRGRLTWPLQHPIPQFDPKQLELQFSTNDRALQSLVLQFESLALALTSVRRGFPHRESFNTCLRFYAIFRLRRCHYRSSPRLGHAIRHCSFSV